MRRPRTVRPTPIEAPDVTMVRLYRNGRAFENHGEDPYLARRQRRPISFTNTGHDAPIGPVLRAPGTGRRRFYDLTELFERPLRLPRWGRRRWGRWRRTIDVELPDRRPAGRT